MQATATEDPNKALIDQLRKHPDFIHLPFPKDWYKKYDIPEPSPMSFKEFIDSGYWFKRHFDPQVEREERGAAPGGIRPVPEPEVIPVEVITKPIKNAETQTDEDNHESTTPKSSRSTESSEKAHLD